MLRIFVLLFCLFPASLFAGQLVVSGVYQGKPLYIQNPYHQAVGSFCTQEVFVNDKKVLDHPKLSAFKIDLSHLEQGEAVVVKITYYDGCTPRVVNPDAIRPAARLKFIATNADHNSISWTTNGEGRGVFVVEKQMLDSHRWTKVSQIIAAQSLGDQAYSIAVDEVKDGTQFRIKYVGDNGEVIYSVAIEYNNI